ncbi:MAG: hypothetical protein ABGW81_02995 [Paracoccaceae bacterium]
MAVVLIDFSELGADTGLFSVDEADRDHPGENWYRSVVSTPLSLGIAAIGAYWLVERIFFQDKILAS